MFGQEKRTLFSYLLNYNKTTAMHTNLFKYASFFSLFFLIYLNCLAQATRERVPARFAVSFDEAVSSPGGADIQLKKLYNLNAGAVSIETYAIKINQAGLYHFDYFIQASANSQNAPSITTYLAGAFPSGSLIFILEEMMNPSSQEGIYKGSWNFSFDIHFPAPKTLHLVRNIMGSTSNAEVQGKFFGHLISE